LDVQSRNAIRSSASATRYKCPDNVLLFPQVRGVSPKSYDVIDNDQKSRIRIEFIDMNRNIMKRRNDLICDLYKIIDNA